MIQIVIPVAAVLIGSAAAYTQQSIPKQASFKTIAQTTSVINTDAGPVKYRVPRRYDNVTLKNYLVTTSHYGVQVKDGSHVTVDGGIWRHNGRPTKISASFAVGGGSMLTLRNVTAIGSYDPFLPVSTKFKNTDGVMGAQRTTLVIEGGTFKNYWDASIDTKANTTLKGIVTVEGSRVGLKDWGPLVGDTLVSRNPRDGHISCLASPAVTCNIHLKKLIAYDNDPNGLLVGFQGTNGVVRIDACELHVPASMRVQWIKRGVTGTNLILGPTCVKDGKVVVAPRSR
jgi:hypothetical protein